MNNKSQKLKKAMKEIDQMVVIARYGKEQLIDIKYCQDKRELDGLTDIEEQKNLRQYNDACVETISHIIACMMSKLTKTSVETSEIVNIVSCVTKTDGQLCKELIKVYKHHCTLNECV